MASLDTFKLKFDDQLTCSVCLDQYIKPKTLPCHHSFCLDCIQRLPVERKGEQYCIRCPTCRVEHPLPEGGAADLPNAFHINSLLELREELVNRKPLAEKLNNSISTSAMTCSIHNDPLKVYCETCCKLICRDCTFSKEHKSHDFELISECYPKYCRQIEAELKLVKHKLADTDTAMAGLTAREREVTDQGEEIKKEIRIHAQQLIDQVVRSERQLMQEVDTTVQHKRQLLKKQREEAERVHSQLKTCEEMIEQNLRELSQEALLMKKQMMIDQMDKARRNIDLAVLQPLEMANIEFTKNQPINGEIGEVKTMKQLKKANLETFPYTQHEEATAILTLYSCDGSCLSLPTSFINCKLSSPGGDQQKCEIGQGREKGVYKILFTPHQGGKYQLIVQVDSVEIPGSPFAITVLGDPFAYSLFENELDDLENSIFSIKDNEKTTYNKDFKRLQPIGGLLTGDKVKPHMMSSKLPVDTLGKVADYREIWNLSDIDGDGNLDADEFAIAMKLISICKKGVMLPSTLPISLIPSKKASKPGLATLDFALPTSFSSSVIPKTPSPIVPESSSDWVVTPDIKAKYDTYFDDIDHDHDGIVNGEQARGILMAFGLPGNVLAHVWNLCDIDKTGELNKEQFALAMYLTSEKVKGKIELPEELSPSMIPPSKRKSVKAFASSSSVGKASKWLRSLW